MINMLATAAQKDRRGSVLTPNLLPCKIRHDGLVGESDKYWKAEHMEGTPDPVHNTSASISASYLRS